MQYNFGLLREGTKELEMILFELNVETCVHVKHFKLFVLPFHRPPNEDIDMIFNILEDFLQLTVPRKFKQWGILVLTF